MNLPQAKSAAHEYFLRIPTYNADTDAWDHREFLAREHFVSFLWSVFKEPGRYEFDETSFKFNEQARQFNKLRFYTMAPFNSKDYIKFWDTQKERCRLGVIYTHKGKT